MARLCELAAGEDIDARTLQAISRSLNDSVRAMAAIRSEREEVREQARRDARGRTRTEMEKKGLGPATAFAIRTAIGGVPDDWGTQARQLGLSGETIAAMHIRIEEDDLR